MKGAILTVGESVGSEVFFLRERKPNYVAMICTTASRNNVTEICTKAGVDFGKFCQIFEVADDAEKMSDFIKKCEEAYRWVKDKCGEQFEISFNPTAGRKWMSTGLSMYAARTTCPVLYVDVEYEDGKLSSGTEKLVPLGNVEDYAAFSESDKGVQLFNRLDFTGAQEVFSSLQPCGSAAARELYTGLAEISDALSRWERFEHYSQDFEHAGLNEALTKVERSAAELGKDMGQFVSALKGVGVRIRKVSQGEKPSLEAVEDLFFNACRRIEVGRLDDGVARLYRTLEACAQWLLSLRGLHASTLDWQKVQEQEAAEFRTKAGLSRNEQLPTKLSLVKSCQLAACLQADCSLAPPELVAAFRERQALNVEDIPQYMPLFALVTRVTEFQVDWSLVSDELKQRYLRSSRRPDCIVEDSSPEAPILPRDETEFDQAISELATEATMIDTGTADEAMESGREPRTLPLRSALDVAPDQVLWQIDPFFNQQGRFVFEKHISSRNCSILAHGWSPIAQEKAEKFGDAVRKLLEDLGAELEGWEVPKLPNLWS